MRAETYEHDECVQARTSVAHAEDGSRTTTCSEAQRANGGTHASPGAWRPFRDSPFRTKLFVQNCSTGPVWVPAPPGVFLPVPCVPCVSRLPPVSFYRYGVWFKDTGGSRDTHETDTRTSQTNLTTNPTHRLTRQTTPEPRDARVAVHHTIHPIKRCGGDGDGDGARTWEQRGREPDGIGDGTL